MDNMSTLYSEYDQQMAFQHFYYDIMQEIDGLINKKIGDKFGTIAEDIERLVRLESERQSE